MIFIGRVDTVLEGFPCKSQHKSQNQFAAVQKVCTLSIVKQLGVNNNKSVLTNTYQKETPSYGVYSTERGVVSEWTLKCS